VSQRVTAQVSQVTVVKGTVSGDFLTLFFSSNKPLLVPFCMPGKDFEFFRILDGLFVFVSPRCIHHWGMETPQCIHH
jgi:hypothetical protein